MSPPPTNIDGTDITGATIDGQDVQSITIDGQEVFGATTLPVAFSNLIAWYPFDSANYGGSNADDVTAIIGGSGDDTAFDGTVNGATYQSNDGVTDIQAGANSGAFSFNNSGHIDLNAFNGFDYANTALSIFDSSQDRGDRVVSVRAGNADPVFLIGDAAGYENNGTFGSVSYTQTTSFNHTVLQNDGSTIEVYRNGSLAGTDSYPGNVQPNADLFIGAQNDEELGRILNMDGNIDDFRIYNRALTATEVSQIFQNTQP